MVLLRTQRNMVIGSNENRWEEDEEGVHYNIRTESDLVLRRRRRRRRDRTTLPAIGIIEGAFCSR
jgi:hypothetical protein